MGGLAALRGAPHSWYMTRCNDEALLLHIRIRFQYQRSWFGQVRNAVVHSGNLVKTKNEFLATALILRSRWPVVGHLRRVIIKYCHYRISFRISDRTCVSFETSLSLHSRLEVVHRCVPRFF